MKSWADVGVTVQVGATGNIKIPCPMCGAQRRGKTDFSLHIEKGVGRCFNSDCNHVVSLRGGGEASKAFKRPAPLQEPKTDQRLYDWFKARGIGRDVVDRNEIVLADAWMRVDMPKMPCIAVPFIRDDLVVNRFYRALEDKSITRLEKNAERTWFKMKDISLECTIVTEGPWDALACEQAGLPNTISVPNGAPPASTKNMDGYFSFLEASEELLKPVEKFVLAMDNDEPGKRLELELARRLGFHRCAKVEWPEGCKDANDVLLKLGGDILRVIIEQATPYPIEGVYSFSSMKEGVLRLYDHGIPRGYSTGWSILDPYYTVLPGHLNIIHGIPNHGKSPWVENLMFNLIENLGWFFGVCSMENRPLYRHAVRLIEKWERTPAFDSGQMDMFRITRERVIEIVEFLDARVSFIAGPRRITLDWVLDKARSLVLRKGLRGLVIDPWNRLEQQRPLGMTEHDYAGECLDRLCDFAQRNAVAVFVVAHPTKLEPHRDRNTGEETQPVPNPYKITGSSHFYNMPDNIICVWRDITGRKLASHLTEIHVQKVKDKYVGMAGGGKKLAFDRRSETFSLPDQGDPPPRRMGAN